MNTMTCYYDEENELFVFLKDTDVKKLPVPNSPEDDYEFFIDSNGQERVMIGFFDVGFEEAPLDIENDDLNTEDALREKYVNLGYKEIYPN